MTEQQRMEIEVGMRVMVKVASREIPATVVEVGESWFLVRSDSTGREFKTNRVVDILDAPAKGEDEEIAQAAAEIADEEAATAELRSREENGENVDEGGVAVDDAEASDTEEAKAEPPKDDEIKVEENKAESPKDEEAKTEEPKTEPPKTEETKAEEPKAEEPRADEPPEADGAKDKEAAPAEAAAAPRKNLSLVDAAVEVLRTEKRPMGVKELVKLATERGLWIPTKAKTPEQSLYGGLYLEMKNSARPRIRKSAEKGRFELIG
ncbi:MAG: HTH domain-containing protein [Bacillota bacterium]